MSVGAGGAAAMLDKDHDKALVEGTAGANHEPEGQQEDDDLPPKGQRKEIEQAVADHLEAQDRGTLPTPAEVKVKQEMAEDAAFHAKQAPVKVGASSSDTWVKGIITPSYFGQPDNDANGPKEVNAMVRRGLAVAKYAAPGDKPVWRIYHQGSSLHFGMDYSTQKKAMDVATKLGDHLDWTLSQADITGKFKAQYLGAIKALQDDPEADLNAPKPNPESTPSNLFNHMTKMLEDQGWTGKPGSPDWTKQIGSKKFMMVVAHDGSWSVSDETKQIDGGSTWPDAADEAGEKAANARLAQQEDDDLPPKRQRKEIEQAVADHMAAQDAGTLPTPAEVKVKQEMAEDAAFHAKQAPVKVGASSSDTWVKGIITPSYFGQPDNDANGPKEVNAMVRRGLAVAKYAAPGDKPVWRIYHHGSSLHFGMDYPTQKKAMDVATKLGDHLDWTLSQADITGKFKAQYLGAIKALQDDPEADLNAPKPNPESTPGNLFGHQTKMLEDQGWTPDPGQHDWTKQIGSKKFFMSVASDGDWSVSDESKQIDGGSTWSTFSTALQDIANYSEQPDAPNPMKLGTLTIGGKTTDVMSPADLAPTELAADKMKGPFLHPGQVWRTADETGTSPATYIKILTVEPGHATYVKLDHQAVSVGQEFGHAPNMIEQYLQDVHAVQDPAFEALHPRGPGGEFETKPKPMIPEDVASRFANMLEKLESAGWTQSKDFGPTVWSKKVGDQTFEMNVSSTDASWFLTDNSGAVAESSTDPDPTKGFDGYLKAAANYLSPQGKIDVGKVDAMVAMLEAKGWTKSPHSLQNLWYRTIDHKHYEAVVHVDGSWNVTSDKSTPPLAGDGPNGFEGALQDLGATIPRVSIIASDIKVGDGVTYVSPPGGTHKKSGKRRRTPTTLMGSLITAAPCPRWGISTGTRSCP